MECLEGRWIENTRNMEDKNASSKVRIDVASRLRGYQNAVNGNKLYGGTKPPVFTISNCLLGMTRTIFASKLQERLIQSVRRSFDMDEQMTMSEFIENITKPGPNLPFGIEFVNCSTEPYNLADAHEDDIIQMFYAEFIHSFTSD